MDRPEHNPIVILPITSHATWFRSSDTSAHSSPFVWSVLCLTLLDIKPTSFFTDQPFPSPTSQVCKKGQSRIRTNFHIYSRTKLMCQHMGYYSTFRWVIPRFRVGYLRVTNPFAMPHLLAFINRKLNSFSELSISFCPELETSLTLLCISFRLISFVINQS